MLTDLGLVSAGLIALFAGGEWLVRGAVALAARLGLPTLLISLTVVGFGTSMPELLVSLRAAIDGQADIALGNVVGSNTANILLIIGLSALIAPIRRWDNSVRRDSVVMVAAAFVTLGLVQFEQIGALSGVAMLTVLAAYICASYFVARNVADAPETEQNPRTSRLMTGVFVLAGLVLLFAGAEALVRGATGMAHALGISEAVIGLTVVAIGTSLPELATSLVAAFRRQSDIAIGNVVGSNIFNILGILALTAVFVPVRVAESFPRFDVPVMLGACLVFATLLIGGRKIGRPVGLALLGGYAAYLAALFGLWP
ncbi:calcium/sodium antiporter [Oricola sp.]|uniref:calcium/sodium antiporter n=1 Tax=Oricola sp. TaxID=1979950 RepID=UPI0025CFCE82|nr:calcium/sodium antiporter [Oricola sp.]MCI5077223.1 calcium/sodium antiporter [Oricola sp.]